MKVVVIGGSGIIGTAVTRELSARHEVIIGGKRSTDLKLDITDSTSVSEFFKNLGRVDAIVTTTGNLHFGPIEETTAEQFNIGLQDKLLGQIRVALIGQHYLSDGGSITLTSGIVADEPIRHGTNATTVNAAVEGFVRSAAIDLPRGIRINAISPTYVNESAGVYGPFFPGYESVPAAKVALAYRRSIEGPQTGRVYHVWH